MTQLSMFNESDDDLKYAAFVEKFKPQKTTDDCYTPPKVYNAIRDYVVQFYKLEKANIIRPFFPGGDYQQVKYAENDVVIDNPPFSIITQICRWYENNGVRFFLFAPYLTCLNGKLQKTTAIITACSITYENGATVATCFLTNLEQEFVCRNDLKLQNVVCQAVDSTKVQKVLPRYEYPDNVITAAMVGKYGKWGIPFAVKRCEAEFISALDEQREKKKTVFGGGLLISEKAAAEKATAEKATAERATRCVWQLSDREREIIKRLGSNDK